MMGLVHVHVHGRIPNDATNLEKMEQRPDETLEEDCCSLSEWLCFLHMLHIYKVDVADSGLRSTELRMKSRPEWKIFFDEGNIKYFLGISFCWFWSDSTFFDLGINGPRYLSNLVLAAYYKQFCSAEHSRLGKSLGARSVYLQPPQERRYPLSHHIFHCLSSWQHDTPTINSSSSCQMFFNVRIACQLARFSPTIVPQSSLLLLDFS